MRWCVLVALTSITLTFCLLNSDQQSPEESIAGKRIILSILTSGILFLSNEGQVDSDIVFYTNLINSSDTNGIYSNRINLEVKHIGDLYLSGQRTSDDLSVTPETCNTFFNGTSVYEFS